MSQSKEYQRWTRLGLGAVVVLILVSMLKPYVIVEAGHRAVILTHIGGGLRQVDEGIALAWPFITTVTPYDTRSQTYTMSQTSWEGDVGGDDSLQCKTSDGQRVDVDISVRFHIDRDQVVALERDVGIRYVAKIIRPAVTSYVQTAIAQYEVQKLHSENRQEVEDNISSRLTEALKEKFIVVDEVLLRNIQFSDTYRKTVEEKQIAQQDAQRMEYVLQKAEKEKEQQIIAATGEAKAIELKGQALAASPEVIEYEYVQKIAPNVQALITDGVSLPLPKVRARSAGP